MTWFHRLTSSYIHTGKIIIKVVYIHSELFYHEKYSKTRQVNRTKKIVRSAISPVVKYPIGSNLPPKQENEYNLHKEEGGLPKVIPNDL